MTSKVKNIFSEAHFDTISRFCCRFASRYLKKCTSSKAAIILMFCGRFWTRAFRWRTFVNYLKKCTSSKAAVILMFRCRFWTRAFHWRTFVNYLKKCTSSKAAVILMFRCCFWTRAFRWRIWETIAKYWQIYGMDLRNLILRASARKMRFRWNKKHIFEKLLNMYIYIYMEWI